MTGIAELIILLTALVKAYPTLAPIVTTIVKQVRAEMDGRTLTDAERAEIDALFDKVDEELEAACAARLAKGDLEA